MSNITLTIGGRDYAVACEPGDEAHVTRLGALIDEKLATMPGAAAQGDARALLFAALMLADELSELRAQSHACDEAGLTTIAARLENLASRLEHRTNGA